MAIKYKEKQHEWFGLRKDKARRSRKSEEGTLDPVAREAKITLSLEGVIMTAIGIILLLVISFAMGVVKGRHIPTGESIRRSKTAYGRIAPLVQETKQVFSPAQEPTREAPVEAVPPEPARVESAPTPPPEAETTGMSFTIQMVTHSKKQLAEKDVEQFKKMGYKSFILRWREYYIVCAGEYATRKDASSHIPKLKKIYADCFVRRKQK